MNGLLSLVLLFLRKNYLPASYHSISAGQTEASQNVWLTAVPYLQGVSSPWDADAPGFETAVTYSAEQVYSVLLALGLDADEIPNAPADWFGGGVSDAAGYVAQMPLCGQVFTGTIQYFWHTASPQHP